MKRRLPAFFIIVLFSVFTVYAQTWLTGSLEEAQSKAKAAGKPLLVDFYVETG